MIKTIIADDEIWVCKLIRNMIDWENLGFQIIDQIYDGMSLLAAIKTEMPDLVITDIRMPRLDGLSVIESASRLGYSTHFIIVSGHHDFKYAKKAIDFGVFSYLTKPVEEQQLIDILTSIKHKHFAPADMSDNLLKQKLEQSNIKGMDLYIKHIIQNDCTLIPSMKYVNSNFSRCFSDGQFNIIAVKIFHHKQDSSILFNNLNALCSSIYNTLETICFDMFSFQYNYNQYILINYPLTQEQLIRQKIQSIYDSRMISVANSENDNIIVGIGTPVANFNQIRTSYTHAISALRSGITHDTNKILDSCNDPVQQNLIDELFINDFISDLTACVIGQSNDSLEELIENMFFEALNIQNLTALDIYDIAFRIINAVLSSMSIKVSAIFLKENPKSKILASFDSSPSLAELQHSVIKYIEKIRSIKIASENGKSNTIDKIKHYINKNYNQDVRLDDVAKHVVLNPNYVSEIFRQETGITFNKYLTNKRMEMARIYLADSRYRINDIAALVGYNDAKHFSKLFKKQYGTTPTNFRKMFL